MFKLRFLCISPSTISQVFSTNGVNKSRLNCGVYIIFVRNVCVTTGVPVLERAYAGPRSDRTPGESWRSFASGTPTLPPYRMQIAPSGSNGRYRSSTGNMTTYAYSSVVQLSNNQFTSLHTEPFVFSLSLARTLGCCRG